MEGKFFSVISGELIDRACTPTGARTKLPGRDSKDRPISSFPSTGLAFRFSDEGKLLLRRNFSPRMANRADQAAVSAILRGGDDSPGARTTFPRTPFPANC